MIGEKLGDRYEIVDEIGRGGMGVVYRARDPLLGREVAVKMLPRIRLQGQAEERFEREARLVAQLDHPAVVPIFDFGRHEAEALYYVMPILEGTPFRILLDAGELSLGEILTVAVQIAEGLDYSHARGVIHRDIKPENIMVTRMEGLGLRARLMDFGLAVGSAATRVTEAGSLMGTVSYFSPEQARGESVDGRSDLYSLGVVLYESLTGTTPFSGSLHTILYRTLHELPMGFAERGVEVDEEMEAIILDCLAKDPERRPARGAHLAERLRRYRGTLGDRERVVVGTPRTSKTSPHLQAPMFVGRELELGELQRQMNAALRGECRFVVVGSEPGMGKTRIVDELDRLAQERRVRVLRGRFSAHGGTIPFQGFCDLVQDFFRTRDHVSTTSSSGPPDLREMAADLIALFPVLSEIEEIREAATAPRSPLPAQTLEAGDRSALHELLARTLARLGGGRPLVLLLENLHVEEASIEALQYVVHRLGPTPTLVVATYRSTDLSRRHPLVRMVHGLADDPSFTALRLGPLSPAEHRALVESMMGEQGVTEALSDQLYESTEGNPFFAVELVRSLVDSGSISRGHTGIWNLVGGRAISPEALPLTIQEAVEKRLERLPKSLREVLAIASVLGRTFDFEDLEQMAGELAEDLDELVDLLLREGLVEEDRRSRGDKLTFKSSVVREVLYGGISRRRKRALHRRHARQLERRWAGRLARVYPRLVHHFAEGDVGDKTLEYGVQLAQQALAAYRPEDAVRATRTALEFVEDEDFEGGDVLEGEIRLLLARALQALGNEESARGEAVLALGVLERAGAEAEAARAALVAAESSWHERRVGDARRWIEKGLLLARSCGENAALMRLLSLSATVSNLRGDYERSRRDVEEMEALAAPASDQGDPLPKGGTLRMALATAPTTVDPARARTLEDVEVLANVFEPLLGVDADGHWTPRLCSDWEESADGTLFRLTLREEARFADGAPVRAADVRFSLERMARSVGEDLAAAWRTVEGLDELAKGTVEHVSGIRIESPSTVVFQLVEPLPFFPALLTDVNTAVVKETADGKLIGSGPFRITAADSGTVTLEAREDYWRPPGPNLDRLEFTTMRPREIAEALRDGRIDLGKDLPPRDLDALLRDTRFRAGLSEAPKKNIYFLLFNASESEAVDQDLRRALVGTLNVEDLVWRALGRFSQPASSLVPPGISGHDPGRRRARLPRDEALTLLEDRPRPIRLRAAVHPLLLERYRALTEAVFAAWEPLGVEIEVVTRTMEDYTQRRRQGQGFDLLLGRWIPDYDDPDAVLAALFHSAHGTFRALLASSEADGILEEARRERNRPVRQVLYRRVENLLSESFVSVPLFHDVDYRVSGPRVRGLRLLPMGPWVNFAEVAAAPEDEEVRAAPTLAEGTVRAALPVGFDSLDPIGATIVEQAEVTSTFLETLTRVDEQTRVGPLLAESWEFEEGARRLHLHLRDGVRFHDGRKMSARDVRWSFERLLTRSVPSSARALLPIRGARELQDGRASELEGLRIIGPTELTLDLVEPVPFFPAMLTHPTTSIVPEGTVEVAGSWRDGCPGTGPFRLVHFDPGQRVELEANPSYWKPNLPRSARLIFELGMTPREAAHEFRAGGLSLASHLHPAEIERLRHEREVRGDLVEMPGLSTYFLVLSCHRGPLADVENRRRLRSLLDPTSLVEGSLGRLALPARGLIPPGLLGHDGAAASGSRRVVGPGGGEGLRLRAWVHPVFEGHFEPFWREVMSSLDRGGVELHAEEGDLVDMARQIVDGEFDVFASRWLADYPDADSFVSFAHFGEGVLGGMCGHPEIDEWIEQARSEVDASRRHELYRQIERRLEEECRVIPLFHEQVVRIAGRKTSGLRVRFSVPEVSWEELETEA